MTKVIFTYYSDGVADLFVKNVESFISHTSIQYDALVICSESDLPRKIVNPLTSTIRVIRVAPNDESRLVKKRSSGNTARKINHGLLTALSYQFADLITVLDPNLFVIDDLPQIKGDSLFFKTHSGLISPSLFTFKPSSQLDQLVRSLLINLDFESELGLMGFNQFVASCNLFGNKQIFGEKFIFSNANKRDEIKEDRLVAIDLLSVEDQDHFKKLHEIRRTRLLVKPVNRLSRIVNKIHSFIDTQSSANTKVVKSEETEASIFEISSRFKGVKAKGSNIRIIHPKQVANHAIRLSELLTDLGFNVSLKMLSPNSPIGSSSPDLHIVMCANVFYDFPKDYIAYQFEQAHSSWFDRHYVEKLNGAIEIWDYSEYNIEYFKGSFKRPHIFIPLSSLSVDELTPWKSRDIDVLFYGEFLKSPRRSEFLTALKQKRDIKIVDGFTVESFGNNIKSLLARTKVVVNHHYYENGQLEVVRLYEAMSYGCKVVSEKSIDDQFHNLPISKYSTVEEADALISEALLTGELCQFTKDSSHYIKTALARLGFVFPNVHNIIDNLSKITIAPRKKKVAVYVHLYYPELWKELNSYLKNLSEPFDLYVNCVESTYSKETVYSIVDEYPSAKIFKSKNIGLDAGGLYTCLKYSPAGSSDVAIILHTKKSPHIDSGETWRNTLISAILGSPEKARETVNLVRSGHGVVSSAKYRTNYPESIGSNLTNLKMLTGRLGYDYSNYPIDFTAGTIFAVKTELLEDIFKVIDYSDFSPGYAIDGTISHAIERLIPNYSVHKKYNLKYV